MSCNTYAKHIGEKLIVTEYHCLYRYVILTLKRIRAVNNTEHSFFNKYVKLDYKCANIKNFFIFFHLHTVRLTYILSIYIYIYIYKVVYNELLYMHRHSFYVGAHVCNFKLHYIYIYVCVCVCDVYVCVCVCVFR